MNPRRGLKLTLLAVSRGLGLFQVARWLTRSRLRILCYHGFALSGESAFRPRLFIEPETFARRLAHLRSERFPVVGLEDALDALDRGSLPRCATVITVDDGFHSFYRAGWPALRAQSMPATVYVTSYYSTKRAPVFRLVIQYMFWKTRESGLDFDGLGLPRVDRAQIGRAEDRHAAAWAIIEHGESRLDEEARQELCLQVGRRLAVDYAAICDGRSLHLVTPEEVTDLAGAGVDVQLHSHRHVLPRDADGLRAEIDENRAVLEPLAGRPLRHFCYPSGIWHPDHWPRLTAAGIRSATTCDAGLNGPETPRLALLRFVDGEDVHDLEFAAEMSGFAELLRRAFSRLFATSRSRSSSDSSD